MPLKEALSRIVNDIDGGIGALVIATDGIPIDEYLKSTVYDVQTMAIEYVTVLREIRSAIAVLDIGGLEELAVHTDKLQAVMRPVNDDLFAIVVLTGEGNYGKARYLLRRDIGIIRKSLE